MAGDDELTARAALSEMQLRIAEGPYSALGLEHHATHEDVRQSFLALTKQYHPARFGRMSSEVQKLSNEVFVGIKAAHDQLQKALGGSVRGGVPSQSGAIPVQADGTERTPAPQLTRRPFGGQPPPGQRGPQFRTQLGTQAPSTQQTQPLARGTDRPGTPPAAGQRAPNVTPSGGTQRISSPAISRTATPLTGPAPRVTPPAGVPVQRTTPAHGIPIQQRPTSSTPAAAPPRPGTPQPAARPTPAGTPPRPSSDLSPGTIRYSGVQAAPPAPAGQSAAQQKAAAFDERSSLRECMMLLNERKWTDARVALHNLAARVPRSKSYLALLCVARGREAHAAGRVEDAQQEYQRALELEPELQLAKQAIAELPRRR